MYIETSQMPYTPLLSKKEVQEVKRMFKQGVPKITIARKFKVSWQVIHYYLTKHKQFVGNGNYLNFE